MSLFLHRLTWFFRWNDWMGVKYMLAQAPCIGISNMVNLAVDAGIQFGKADFTCLIQIQIMLKTASEFDDIARLYPAMCGIDDKAKPRNTMLNRNNLCLCVMNSQAQGRQKINEGLFPCVELPFAVAE